MDNLVIKKMTDYKVDISKEVSEVFVDAYYKDLSYLSKNKEKLRDAFMHSFNENVIYVAELNGKIVGILGCADDFQRALSVNKYSLRKYLGFLKGSLAYMFMYKEFNEKLEFGINVGYIEAVGVLNSARRLGVATKLMSHVMKTTKYKKLKLEVTDNNIDAIKLYEKLGFYEVDRIKEKFKKTKDFKERIYMEWTNNYI
ncbi:MAG: GNAT family N-acetyltransferase [Bacilli bacterium]